MVAELVQDLLHLERGRERLDEHRRLDRALREVEPLLRPHEDVVPEARLFVTLELGQVEVRSAAALEELLRVVEEVQAEVHERAGDRLAVDQEVLLEEVPAARPHDHRRERFVQRVALALGAREVDLPADRVDEVGLAGHHVLPGRGVRILEVGHVRRRAGVERIDDHLAIGRAGDLDLAHFEVGGDPPDAPPPHAGPPRVRTNGLVQLPKSAAPAPRWEAALPSVGNGVRYPTGGAVARHPAGPDAVAAEVGRNPWLFDRRLTTLELPDDALPANRAVALDWPVPYQAEWVGVPPRLLISRLRFADRTLAVLLPPPLPPPPPNTPPPQP